MPELVQYFSSVGNIKCDRETKKPRVWLYHDKTTGQPTGECTITYCDSAAQQSALQTYDQQMYQGHPTTASIPATSTSKSSATSATATT